MSETRDETFTRAVLREVLAERGRQHAKWGEQNLSDGTAGVTPDAATWDRVTARADAARARRLCQEAAASGYCTWMHVLREEVAEAFAEEDPALLRAELIQVAAVAVAWVEAIDRRATCHDES